ncbi:MAG: methyltransferase domain-containing protein [Planctomycetota bacterium]|nr:methyltransferase domain-containing protein [Planctomycetota bacterium]
MKSDRAYYRHERPELVAHVRPADGNRVLDVGCGAGHVAARIKREQRAGEVWGVEVVEAAAHEARANPAVDEVRSGDLERIVGELPDGHFSHVICGDVLEHLVDPWTALAGLRRKLRPDGRVICSLPNVRNLSFLAMLIFEGSFRYRESGVMDRTHLRWFCRKDARALFEGAGFADVTIGPVRPKRSLSNRASRLLLRDWATKGFLILGRNPG